MRKYQTFCLFLPALWCSWSFASDLKTLERECENGVFVSCTSLGSKYFDGNGFEKNRFKSAELFTKACAGNDPLACTILGIMHEDGDSVPQDSKKAAGLYLKACDGGGGLGCNNLGVMLADGPYHDKALLFFEKSCNFKFELGCFNYARLKNKGRR